MYIMIASKTTKKTARSITKTQYNLIEQEHLQFCWVLLVTQQIKRESLASRGMFGGKIIFGNLFGFGKFLTYGRWKGIQP